MHQNHTLGADFLLDLPILDKQKNKPNELQKQEGIEKCKKTQRLLRFRVLGSERLNKGFQLICFYSHASAAALLGVRVLALSQQSVPAARTCYAIFGPIN